MARIHIYVYEYCFVLSLVNMSTIYVINVIVPFGKTPFLRKIDLQSKHFKKYMKSPKKPFKFNINRTTNNPKKFDYSHLGSVKNTSFQRKIAKLVYPFLLNKFVIY